MMIHLKLSALSVALGAATTLGFVWLARSRKRPATGAPLEEPGPPARDAVRDVERLAQRDAFHAFHASATEAETEFDVSDEASDLESQSEGLLPTEDPFPTEEPYDAVDPEDIGSEWLRRATGAPSGRVEFDSFPDEGDAMEELPVGHVDTDGNTELHPPHRASKQMVDLSPNNEELEQRAATAEGEAPGKRHE